MTTAAALPNPVASRKDAVREAEEDRTRARAGAPPARRRGSAGLLRVAWPRGNTRQPARADRLPESGREDRRQRRVRDASGRALVPALRAAGHDVLRLVRREEAASDEIRWDPAAGELDAARLQGVDAVVSLSGANVGQTVDRRPQARDPRLARSAERAAGEDRSCTRSSAHGVRVRRRNRHLRQSRGRDPDRGLDARKRLPRRRGKGLGGSRRPGPRRRHPGRDVSTGRRPHPTRWRTRAHAQALQARRGGTHRIGQAVVSRG